MYFLYFYSFRFRISSIDPSILLNESRSMQTTLTAVKHLTLACLGVFLTKAISPKQSPSLNSNTFLESFSAISLPSAIMQNLFPYSPSRTMYSPGPQVYSFKISQSCSFQQGPTPVKIQTFDKIVLNFSLLFFADSSTMYLKVVLSSPYKIPLLEQFIEAARGTAHMRASYPKYSPSLQVFKQVYFPPIDFTHSYQPEPTTQRVNPSSPSLMIFWPPLNSSIDMASITMFMSWSGSGQKRTDFFSNSLMASLASEVFWMIFGVNYCLLLKVPQTSALIPCLLIFFWFFFCFSFSWRILSASSLSSYPLPSDSE